MENPNKYSDITLNFIPHPGEVFNTGKGDLVKVTDELSVKQSLRNLFSFTPEDKAFHPEISMNLRAYMFENTTVLTNSIVQRIIGDIISRYEPRVNVNSISMEMDEDSYAVTIFVDYSVKNISVPQQIEFKLIRVR